MRHAMVSAYAAMMPWMTSTGVCRSRTSVVMATLRKNESITIMKLARETMESVAQTNFRSTITLPALRPTTDYKVRGALYIHFVAAALRNHSCSLQTLFVFKQGLTPEQGRTSELCRDK